MFAIFVRFFYLASDLLVSSSVLQGGQRVATLLVYLKDMPVGSGGATAFRDLGPTGPQPRSKESDPAQPLEV